MNEPYEGSISGELFCVARLKRILYDCWLVSHFDFVWLCFPAKDWRLASRKHALIPATGKFFVWSTATSGKSERKGASEGKKLPRILRHYSCVLMNENPSCWRTGGAQTDSHPLKSHKHVFFVKAQFKMRRYPGLLFVTTYLFTERSSFTEFLGFGAILSPRCFLKRLFAVTSFLWEIRSYSQLLK